jgi:predicted nucleotidyltransferase
VIYLYICVMTHSESIKSTLSGIKSELAQKYNVSSIGIFGSAVRDDFSSEHSDIDIIVDFSKPIGIEFINLADFLENKLHRKVDLVSKKGIKEAYYREIEREIIYV